MQRVAKPRRRTASVVVVVVAVQDPIRTGPRGRQQHRRLSRDPLHKRLDRTRLPLAARRVATVATRAALTQARCRPSHSPQHCTMLPTAGLRLRITLPTPWPTTNATATGAAPEARGYRRSQRAPRRSCKPECSQCGLLCVCVCRHCDRPVFPRHTCFVRCAICDHVAVSDERWMGLPPAPSLLMSSRVKCLPLGSR